MRSQSNLQEDLQAEFSPPLDASLIAAIIGDHVEGNKKPSPQQIKNIRGSLSQLAAQAEQDERPLSDGTTRYTLNTSNSSTDDASSLNGSLSIDTNTAITTPCSSNNSDASLNSPQSLNSPLGFLRAVFPHLPISTLRNALGSMGDIDDIDMEAVMETIWSKEYIRELEERGLEDSDEVEDDESAWQTAGRKKTFSLKATKKPKKPLATIILGNVRPQQQRSQAYSAPNSPRGNDGPDPWTQVSSLATYLSTLVPHPASLFQSAFHDPRYASPSIALRATLTSISPAGVPEAQRATLLGLFEILVPFGGYDDLSSRDRDGLLADIQLAFRATQFDPDASLSLYEAMRELDMDIAVGENGRGLYHSPVPSYPVVSSRGGGSPQQKSATVRTLPSGPPPAPPPLRQQHTSPLPSASSNAWQTVPIRRPTTIPGYPHADFIPDQNTTRKGKVKGAGNGMGKGGKGDVGELSGRSAHSARARELMKRTKDAYREAGRAWQRRAKQPGAGEVALFYSSQARKLHEEACNEKMAAAREMVLAKKVVSSHGTTIDLHGTTVLEAISIVQNILAEEVPTEAKPLKVITGRGLHSANGRGVLRPQIKTALEADGWNVVTWGAGLIVRA